MSPANYPKGCDRMPPYVGLHRKIIGWKFHQDSNTMNTLIHLLAISSEEAQIVRGVEIGIGQIVCTKVELSKLIGLSYKQLRTCMQKLEECRIIATQTIRNLSVITILQSDLYALIKKSQDGELGCTLATSRATPMATQRATPKNAESLENKSFEDALKHVEGNFEGNSNGNSKGNSKGNQKTKSKYSEKPAYTPEFERFWEQYPNHKDKRDAFKAWKQVNPSDEIQEKILYDISTRHSRGDWLDAKYIPMAGTYLRGWRWEDELKKQTTQPNHTGYYNPMFEYAEQLKRLEENG